MSTNNLNEALQKVAQNLEWERPEVVEFTIEGIRETSNMLMKEALDEFRVAQEESLAQYQSDCQAIIDEMKQSIIDEENEGVQDLI